MTLSDLVDAIASHVGIAPDTAHKALGVLLNFLRSELGPGTFGKLESAIPGATEMMDDAPKGVEETTGGGLLSAITSAAGKILGGNAGEGVNLVAILNGLGLTSAQIESFLTKAIELIKEHVPPEVIEKVLATVPAAGSLLGKLLAPGHEPAAE